MAGATPRESERKSGPTRNALRAWSKALVAELAYHHVVNPTQWLCITRSKQVLGRKCRYRPSICHRKAHRRDGHARTAGMGLAELQLGYQRRALHGGYVGRQTRLRAGERLVERITVLGLDVDDFGLHESEEVIVLNRSKGDSFWDVAALMDYDDTPQTDEMREQVRRINRWIAAAAIEYSGTRRWTRPSAGSRAGSPTDGSTTTVGCTAHSGRTCRKSERLGCVTSTALPW